MARNKVEIILSLKDIASRQFKKTYSGIQGITRRFSENWKKHWLRNTALIMGAVLALRKLSQVAMATAKSLIGVANKVEQLGVRLKVLLGSAEEGNKVFEDMTRLAGQVPKTYDEIMTAATDLAAVFRGGREEIAKLMPIVVDISAATGMAVREVTSQVIRMYSAGAAAADMFRERGVLAALGFQAGVAYTAEETMKVMVKQWEDGTGKFVGASKELATAFTGMISMMEDAWFIFRRDIGKPMFEALKADLAGILALVEQSKEEGGAYGKVVQDLKGFFDEAYNSAKEFVAIGVVGIGQLIDVYNDLAYYVQKYINFNRMAAIGLQKLGIIAERIWFRNTEVMEQALADMEIMLAEGIEREREMQEARSTDYSLEFKIRLENFKLMLIQMKEEYIKVSSVIETVSKETSDEQVKDSKKTSTAGESAAGKIGSSFGSVMAGMIMDGKDFTESMIGFFRNMARQFISAVSAMIVKWLAFKALKAAFGVGFFHGGGEVKHKGGPVKKAHSGMLATDEVPIIAQTGEGILSRRGMAALAQLNAGMPIGGGGVNVTINVAADVSNNVDIALLAEELGFYVEREVSRARTIG